MPIDYVEIRSITARLRKHRRGAPRGVLCPLCGEDVVFCHPYRQPVLWEQHEWLLVVPQPENRVAAENVGG